MSLFVRNQQSILFLHVPKCGGSSVVEMFAKNGFSAQLEMRGLPAQDCLLASPQHQTSIILKNFIKPQNLSDIFILVRNPYNRIISEFKWTFRNIPCSEQPEFNQWIIESLKQASIDIFHADNHFRPTIDFIETDMPCKVFKLEDGLNFISEFFLQEEQETRSIKTAHNKNSKEFKNASQRLTFNNESIHAINNFYKYDFMAFEYERMDDETKNLSPWAVNDDEYRDKLEKIDRIKEWRATTLKALRGKLKNRVELLRIELKDSTNLLKDAIAKKAMHPININQYSESSYDEILLHLFTLKAIINPDLFSCSAESNTKEISQLITFIDQYRFKSTQP